MRFRSIIAIHGKNSFQGGGRSSAIYVADICIMNLSLTPPPASRFTSMSTLTGKRLRTSWDGKRAADAQPSRPNSVGHLLRQILATTIQPKTLRQLVPPLQLQNALGPHFAGLQQRRERVEEFV